MAAIQHNVDQVTTNDDDISQPMMKIMHTNIHLILSLDMYLNELQMIVQTLNTYVLSFALYGSFSILMQWLSLAASTTVYNKTTKVVTSHISSSKTKNLIQK